MPPSAPSTATGPTGLVKFGPLAAVAAVQLLLVLLVPSVGRPIVANAGSTFSGSASVSGIPGAPVDGGGPGAKVGTGLPAGPGGGRPAVGTSAPGTAGTGTSPGTAGSGGRAVTAHGGETKHCVQGRQYDPAIDPFAPPCVPGIPGSFSGDNGGATAPGVTKEEVRVTVYVPNHGAAIDTVLRAQGLYYDASNVRDMAPAFTKFINDKFQLYGRKVTITAFQGTCSVVPPQTSCLLPEMDKMVAETKPYAVVFVSTVCSACFTELARKGVVTTGSTGFSDALLNANAPYMYSLGMSSTKMQQAFARFWCGQMTSKGGTGRTAIFGGAQNPAQDFRKQPRQLGVMSTNDPDALNTVRTVLYPSLDKGCGDSVDGHEYFYSQDVANATQQSQAGIARMNTTQNPATSVLCLCDPVAPLFIYNAAANNNYWPETLIASNQLMDTDNAGQSYGGGAGCPQGARGCTFDNALGLGDAGQAVPSASLAVTKVYQAGGGGALPIAATAAQQIWESLNQIMSLVENTGPQLTAGSMQAAAPGMGLVTGPGGARRGFASEDWSWSKDVRLTYWSKNQKSPVNDKAGHYFSFGGRRFLPDEIPGAAQPAAPLAEQR